MMENTKEKYMNSALRLAKKAETLDEVPVGAVIVQEGKIIGRGYNRRQTRQNSLEHAELMAIAQACRKLSSWRLEGCDLYVTLEPCPMCAGAIIQSRIEHVYFGAFDAKGGAVGSVTNLFELTQWNHHPAFEGGILEEECSTLLKAFFKEKRRKKKLEKQLRKQQEQNECSRFQNQTEGPAQPFQLQNIHPTQRHAECSCDHSNNMDPKQSNPPQGETTADPEENKKQKGERL